MDNIKFGAFVAQLRQELGMTQRELAERLHVTDKAVSKWETGRGFPDLKLLEPLAQELGVSLVELLQGERSQSNSLTLDQAQEVVSQAMDQSQRVTARRYLRLLRWLLVGVGAVAAYTPIISVIALVLVWYLNNSSAASFGIIGGADGPTGITVVTSDSPLPHWLTPLILAVVAILCIVLALKVWKLEKKLK